MKKYKFTKPLNAPKNIHHNDIKEKGIKWVENSNILNFKDKRLKKKVVALDLALFASLIFPNANEDQLQLCNEFFTFFFILDDIMEESEPEVVRYLKEEMRNIMLGKHYKTRNDISFNATNFFHSFVGLVNRVKANFHEDKTDIFVFGVIDDFMDGCVGEADARGGIEWTKMPTMQQYESYRYKNGASLLTFFFIQLFRKISNKTMMDSRIKRLDVLAGFHAIIINDFYSIPKDIKDNMPNYVLLLVKEKNWTIEQAKDYTFQKIEDSISEIYKIYNELKAEDFEEALSYAEGLIDVVNGNSEYSEISTRYHGFQNNIIFNQETNEFTNVIEQLDVQR